MIKNRCIYSKQKSIECVISGTSSFFFPFMSFFFFLLHLLFPFNRKKKQQIKHHPYIKAAYTKKTNSMDGSILHIYIYIVVCRLCKDLSCTFKNFVSKSSSVLVRNSKWQHTHGRFGVFLPLSLSHSLSLVVCVRLPISFSLFCSISLSLYHSRDVYFAVVLIRIFISILYIK